MVNFPIINITGDKWDDLEDPLCDIHEDRNYYSKNKKILNTYYLNHKFCDSNGNIFELKKLVPRSGGIWNKILTSLPGSVKGEFVLNPTTKTIPLNEFKLFMLKKVNELPPTNFTKAWIIIIQRAQTYKEILMPEIEIDD